MRYVLSCLAMALTLPWFFDQARAEDQAPALVSDPALSPDGETLWFAYRGDLWSVPLSGGVAKAWTSDPAREGRPLVAPDGQRVAFLKEVDKAWQVHLLDLKSGVVRQITSHSEGYGLMDWYPDGKALLVGANRDATWKRQANARLMRVELENQPEGHARERILFEEYGAEAKVDPVSGSIHFVREGEAWWRQNYVGSKGGQIWTLEGSEARMQVAGDHENRWPMPAIGREGFYYVSNRGGSSNLWWKQAQADRPLTKHQEDPVVFPALSRNGKRMVYRQGLHLWSLSLEEASEPKRVEIQFPKHPKTSEIKRPRLSTAQWSSVSSDGLQIAFIAGGEVWVMDTVLKEPKRVTYTAEEEREVSFSPDGKELWYVSDREGQPDLWKARASQEKHFLWEAEAFVETRVTHDAATEFGLCFSPDGKRVAWLKDRGDLWVADSKGQGAKRILEAWDAPKYEFSPDGAWIAAALMDESFNRDIWILPSDGSAAPRNISLHPFDDHEPKWSPDGKRLAWVGLREDKQSDIFWAWLREEDGHKSQRDRLVEKANEKFKSLRSAAAPKPAAAPSTKPAAPSATPNPASTKQPEPKKFSESNTADSSAPTLAPPTHTATTQSGAPPKAGGEPHVTASVPNKIARSRIDFEGIEKRTFRIRFAGSRESGLLWAPDSSKLAFNATVDGRVGLYTVNPPESDKPRLLASTSMSQGVWSKKADAIFGLHDRRLLSVSGKGGITHYPFSVNHRVERTLHQKAVFEQAWRHLRDKFYDDSFNRRNWDEARAKYAPAAAAAADERGLQEVILMMMGELNASHMGFSVFVPRDTGTTWRDETAHLGLLFDQAYQGKGWKVKAVIDQGPTGNGKNSVKSGELVVSIDGREVQANDPLSAHLNGPLDRQIRLKIASSEGGPTRDVMIRPITYQRARELMYQQWVSATRKKVETLSQGRLGYLHIAAMDQESFNQFQTDLYRAGAGKVGLVIDVRENGGGSTTDLLLTALTQPQHAITLPRGGAAGYPQDRMVFATWNKPIVVLCNQNSFSNAEVFSHAIQTLKRGKVVGVPTPGGVISTGSVTIMDAGIMRMPFRGFYHVQTGEDYERHGVVPDVILWPNLGEDARGEDSQLAKAMELLEQDVAAWEKLKLPVLRKASDR